ncbi:MAG TPA: ABC transporter substrate-binding protein [Candidatus Limnocylindrales bacterium]|nr:ABC transporter substrate-binding protein [Candidatus Limnocylindrales bacterium]
MRSSIRARLAAIAATVGLILAGLAPTVAPTLAQTEPLVIRAGTDQDLQVLNPFNSILVVDFEVFTLNYDLLVNFGPDLEPVPGFAETWDVSDDGLTWTFKIREGMLWSDGEPATSEDARYTFQLALDADALSQESEDGYYLGAGYLEPYLLNAGLTAVSAPDPETLVVETAFPNTLLLQAYMPILPKHIWSSYTIDDIANYSDTPFLNEPPVVGTGPYQAVEWQAGEFIRFARNPNYWGDEGAAEEVIILTFESSDTMVQALTTGQVDYVRGVQPAQFDALANEPDIETVEGISNGYSEIAFNTKGNTEGYGGSTSALTDPAFRDALAWAVDQERLVEVTLGGYGVPGDSIVPPFHTRWYSPPENPRSFDIAEANRRLDAAGYERGGDGIRLDAEGRPITLRVTWPDSEAEHETDAQFLQEWWGELGIGVDAYQTEEGKLLEDLVPPVSGGPANFDIELWGWVGDPDPTSLLNVLRTEEIGSFSDSFWSNARYDELFLEQRAEADEDARFEMIKEMQEIAYEEAPYIIMYYDAELHAYRTDKFGGWRNQPTEGGTPLFGYGSGGYNTLTDLNAEPTPGPTDPTSPTAGPTPAPSGSGSGDGGGDSTPLILGIVGLVVVAAGALLLMRRRSAAAEDE